MIKGKDETFALLHVYGEKIAMKKLEIRIIATFRIYLKTKYS